MRWIGLDVHQSYVQATEIDTDGEVQHYREALTNEGLEALKLRFGADASVALESSTSAFRLYDELVEHARQVVVVHSAQTRGASALHVKTDRRDSEILARLLMTGFIRPVWVPPLEYRTIRGLAELRYTLVTLHTAFINRAKACLREHRMDNARGLSRGRSFEAFERIIWPDANIDTHAEAVVALAKTLQEQMKCIDTALEAWTASKPEARLLLTIPGVGVLLAATILSEIGDVKRFPTPDNLCAYAGLAPKVHASGKTLRIGGVSRGGRVLIKRALWLATFGLVKGDGRFHQLHAQLVARRPRKVARLAIARRLLIVIWHMLRRGKEFRRQPLPSTAAPLGEGGQSVS